MQRKKFYLPIGLCILVVLAVGFLFLRSQTPQEPIRIYKVTTPDPPAVKVSETPETTTTALSIETEASEVQGSESDTQSDTEFTRSELLKRFPQYDFHSPESKENLHAILRGEKTFAKKEARLAFLKRKVAEQEAAKELHDYVNSTMLFLETEYADVEAFSEKYADAQEIDFIREFPDETERNAFLARMFEAGKIRKELADRILATPFIVEILPPRTLEILHDTANAVSIDEISAAQANLEILRSREVSK